MDKPCIYIVGKPYPHMDAVEEIKRLGYRLGLFLDINASVKHPEHYERIIRLDFSGNVSLSQQLSAIKDIQIDGVYCLYENYIISKAEISSYYQIPALSVESAKMCTDKHLMREAFMAADPSITPRHRVVTSESELRAFAESARYPLMLKPTNLVKSLLVTRCDNWDELLSNYRYATKTIGGLYEQYNIYGREPQLIVEEFISGRLCSVAAMIEADGTAHFCEGIVSLTNAHDHGKDDSYIYERLLPGIFDPPVAERIFATSRYGIQALGLTSSSAHVELIYDGIDVRIVEIGARTGGYRERMYRDCYGIDLLEQELGLAVGKRPRLDGKLLNYCSVVELFPDSDGKFESITGPLEPTDYQYFAVKASPGQPIGPAKHGFKAAAVLSACAKDRTDLDRIRQNIDKLEVKVHS